MERDLTVRGFRFAAVKAGFRGKDRLDLGLIVADEPAMAAAVFTRNAVKAAPVLLGQKRLSSGRIQAVLVNSGIANACTGEQGMANAEAAARLAAMALGIDEALVVVSSTGVIGEQFDMSCFERAVGPLASALSPGQLADVTRAIMTTDTVPKTAERTITLSGQPVRLVGIAKGAGMIMPRMATMLAYVMTDAAIGHSALQAMLSAAAAQSFNRISVDGDMSTNDTLLVLASGKAGNVPITEADCPDGQAFRQALDDLTRDLAIQIVRDGEGASKFVTIAVRGGRSEAEAEQVARAVANSPLVKTAFFGQDANWGRIIAAVGASGVAVDPMAIDIAFDGIPMVRRGIGLGREAEAKTTEVLKQDAFTIGIDLHQGEATVEFYTCDFSIDYVKINADYRS